MKEVFCDSRPHIIFAFSEFFLWDNSECFAHPPSFKHTILDNLDASPARPSCIEKTREIILKEIPRLLVYGVAGAGIYYCVTLTSGIEEHSFQAASLSSDAFLEQTESSCPSSYITNTTVPGYLNQYCDNACAFLNRIVRHL